MKNILVTGGAGYIGSHVCKLLKLYGYNPIVFDNLSTGSRSGVKWGELFVGDVVALQDIESVFLAYKIDAVVHLAAKLAVGESVQNPAIYYENNVLGSKNLIDMMLKYKVEHIVFSSSAAVYGIPSTDALITEDILLAPINPYGRTKKMTEELLHDYAHVYPLSFVALRYFNACGADVDLETGWYNQNPQNLIPIIVKRVAENQSFQVYGNDYNTADGTCVRDYIHVLDLAQAHVQSLEYLMNKNQNAIFNLGTGKGCSVLDIIQSMEKIIEKPLQYDIVARREGDPDSLIADTNKAKSVLDWQVKYGLDDILMTAWQWQKKIISNN